jgi:Transposase DDE domain
MTSLLELYCHVDDFCQQTERQWATERLRDGGTHRQRSRELSDSEIMTLLIHFHQSQYRTFKAYYTQHVQVHLRQEFPDLVSYGRFVQLMPGVFSRLCAYLFSLFGRCTGVSFIDSTFIAVCDNRRIHQHKVFAGLATRGRGSMGWSFGFKLHLVVNDCGELLGCCLTPAHRADVKLLPMLTRRLFGKLFGDKGYLSQPMFEQLLAHGVQLITRIKSNMKNRLMSLSDKLLLRKRAIIESITDQLKNVSQIEHTRHRSPLNFCINLICGLIAYCHQPKKPSLRLDLCQLEALSYP